MDLETPVRSLLSPLGIDLYDLELSNGTLNIVVTKEGGINLDEVTKANRTISEWLDANDPIAGRYTLDVSSPGLERKLRTPRHFQSTVGEVVTLRERRDGQPTRRLEGTVLGATETEITLKDKEAGEVTVPLSNIERARTVFAWGAEKPVPARTKQNQSSKKG
jgi:ribosome maturation factor RimP